MESVFLRLSAWSVRPCTTSRMFGHFRISDRRWLFAKVVKGTVKMGNQTSDLVHIQSNVPLPHARQVIPRKQKPPVYDPLHGFPDGRKERVMIATEKEMDDADMPTLKRDYCAHLYIAWKQCHMEKGGLYCHKEKHDYSHCEHEDFLMRKKEYERERRLHERVQKTGKLIGQAA